MHLGRLIRNRQDELRGRPEDWLDRFGDWRRQQDWPAILIVLMILAVLAC